MATRPKPPRAYHRPQIVNDMIHPTYLKQHVYLPFHYTERRGVCTVRSEGESGRRSMSPFRFCIACFGPSLTLAGISNVLWPIVPFAFVLHYTNPQADLLNFILAYVAMVPSANMLDLASRELARKLPCAVGTLVETTCGSLVELIMLGILVRRGDEYIPVIKAAVLGSILANLLLCLGLCLFFGRLGRKEVVLHDALGKIGGELMLVAGSESTLNFGFASLFTDLLSISGSSLACHFQCC
jgi:Ca2+:H+ antiporter